MPGKTRKADPHPAGLNFPVALTARALLDSSPQSVIAVDDSETIVLVNGCSETMFGYREEELIGRKLDLLVPESIRGRHAEFHKDYFANMRSRPMGNGLELEGRRKDGSLFPVEIGLGAIDTDGRKLAVAFVADVGKRREAERALRRSELQYRALFEHMNEGVAYCRMIFEDGIGTDYIYLAVNQRMEELTGLKNVVGRRVTDVIPSIRETDPELLRTYARVAQTGRPETFEMFIRAVRRWYSISAYSPETGFFVAVFDDITERRNMEETLRKSEERMRLAVESTGVGTFDYDPRTHRRIWSDVAKSYFGLPPDAEPDDATVRDIIHPDDRARAYRALEDALRPGSTGLYSNEFRTIARSNGQLRWISVWGRILFDANGQPDRAIGVFLDITERKRLEEVAETSRREIHALAASLMTAQEDERRRVSRELHDQICQELAALAIDIGSYAAAPPPGGRDDWLKALQARVVGISEETRHIAYELHPSILDDLGLALSLRDLCRQVSETAGGMAIKFTDAPLGGPVPREVASCLYRVAQESLRNVVKHSGAKRVTVALTARNGAIVLTIADNGAGFDPEAAKGRGGLGLVGMEERVFLVNGKLSIHTKPKRGTKVVVEVPLLWDIGTTPA